MPVRLTCRMLHEVAARDGEQHITRMHHHQRTLELEPPFKDALGEESLSLHEQIRLQKASNVVSKTDFPRLSVELGIGSSWSKVYHSFD